MAKGHMVIYGLNTLWVGLKSEFHLQWLNGTFAERSLAPNQIRGPCIIYDDNEIFAVTCDNQRDVICSISSTANPHCGRTPMTWEKANNYCVSQGGTLWQDLHPPKKSFLPCLSTHKGLWLGIQVVRKATLLTLIPDIAREEDCPLKGKEDWTPKCGLLRRDSQDNVVCSLVACTEKHPYLCDERPLATTMAEHVTSKGFQPKIAIWKISLICISIGVLLLIFGAGTTIAVRKRRSAKKGRTRRTPVVIQQLKQGQGSTMKLFETASSRGSSKYDSMYQQIDYNNMSSDVSIARGVPGPSQEVLGKLQDRSHSMLNAWKNRGRGNERETSGAIRYENTKGGKPTLRTEQKNYDGYLRPREQFSKFEEIEVPLPPSDVKMKRDFIKAFKRSQAENQKSNTEQKTYDGYLHLLMQSPKSSKLGAIGLPLSPPNGKKQQLQ